jgi:large subunit ribosomal protein L28
MSRVCSICGKSRISGNKVSHSNIKTKRVWNTNVHKVKTQLPSGQISYQYICTRCLRTMKKDAE